MKKMKNVAGGGGGGGGMLKLRFDWYITDQDSACLIKVSNAGYTCHYSNFPWINGMH